MKPTLISLGLALALSTPVFAQQKKHRKNRSTRCTSNIRIRWSFKRCDPENGSIR